MNKTFLFLFILLSIYGCSTDDDKYVVLVAETGEELSGGDNTSFNFSAEAFGFASPNLSFDERLEFGLGNSLFNQSWVTAPASTTARDGLGPLFNARSCSGCHFKDGRGRPPNAPGELSHGLVLRLHLPGTDSNGFPIGDPVYGRQLQDNSILDVATEGSIIVNYVPLTESYPDGKTVTLQKPTYLINDLAYGPTSAAVISPRVANQLIGLGLIDALDDATILAFQDIYDADGDGISGKANFVYNVETASLELGRYGWKANQPSIKQQVAAAFSGDLGITSSLFPEENCPSNTEGCPDLPNGGTPEIINENLQSVSFYSSTLAVPARRNVSDQKVLQGKELFTNIQCVSCHKPKLVTGIHPVADLSNQVIRPYTDVLLHDMGDGLADGASEFLANGREWRTPPLWGLGLIETVNGHTNLLHDGRARNIEEAILWHGGEAEQSKENFKSLTLENREAIITFLKSL